MPMPLLQQEKQHCTAILSCKKALSKHDNTRSSVSAPSRAYPYQNTRNHFLLSPLVRFFDVLRRTWKGGTFLCTTYQIPLGAVLQKYRKATPRGIWFLALVQCLVYFQDNHRRIMPDLQQLDPSQITNVVSSGACCVCAIPFSAAPWHLLQDMCTNPVRKDETFRFHTYIC